MPSFGSRDPFGRYHPSGTLSYDDLDWMLYPDYDPYDESDDDDLYNMMDERPPMRKRRPFRNQIHRDNMMYQYDPDEPGYHSDSITGCSRYCNNHMNNGGHNQNNRPGNRSRRPEQHHHLHYVIYPNGNNNNNMSNNNDNNNRLNYNYSNGSGYPISHDMMDRQQFAQPGGMITSLNRPAIAAPPATTAARGMIAPPFQSSLNQCGCHCCMIARSHNADCPLAMRTMHPAALPRVQYGPTQRLLQ